MLVNKILASSLNRFSSIVFSQNSKILFELKREMAPENSLKNLINFSKNNFQKIEKAGKSILFENLNKISFVNKDFEVFKDLLSLITSLQNCNLYESQMRYSILLKMKEIIYTTDKNFTVIDKEIKKQKAFLEKSMDVQIDFVTALNWFLLIGVSDNDRINSKCLQVINSAKQEYVYFCVKQLVVKLTNRLINNNWVRIRNLQFLFKYLTNEFDDLNGILGFQIAIIDRIAQLQLHKMGYGRVPLIFDHFFNKLIMQINQKDLRYIIRAFSFFKYLPYSYNEKAFSKIFQTVLQLVRKQRNTIIDFLPFKRMTVAQRQLLMGSFNPKILHFKNILYYINTFERSYFLVPIIIKRFQDLIFVEEITKDSLKNNYIFHSYLAISKLLIQHYGQNEQFEKRIGQRLQYVYDIFLSEFSRDEILENASLCNLLHINYFQQKYKLLKNNKVAKDNLNLYYSMRRNRFRNRHQFYKKYKQMTESLNIYANSPNENIKSIIRALMKIELQLYPSFNFQVHSFFIFIIQQSPNKSYYAQISQSLWTLIKKEDFVVLAQYYLKYNNRTQKIMSHLLLQFSNNDANFQCYGKFIAGASFSEFVNNKNNLLEILKRILEKQSSIITPSDLQNLTFPDILNILNFCVHFRTEISQFAHKFLMISINIVEEAFEKLLRDYSSKKVIGYISSAIYLSMLLKKQNKLDCIKKLTKILDKLDDQKSIFVKANKLELKTLTQNTIIGLEQQAKLDEIIIQLRQSGFHVKNKEVMLILIKLHSLNKIILPVSTIQDITKALRIYLQRNANGIEIIKAFGITFKHLLIQYQPSQQTLLPLAQILKNSVQVIKGIQHFDFYYYLLQISHIIKNKDLFSCLLDAIINSSLPPLFITKLLPLIKYYPHLVVKGHLIAIQNAVRSYDRAYDEIESLKILFFLHKNCVKIENIFLKTQKKFMKKIGAYLKSKCNQLNQQLSTPDLFSKNKGLINYCLKYVWIKIKKQTIVTVQSEILLFLTNSVNFVIQPQNRQYFNEFMTKQIWLVYICIFKTVQKLLSSAMFTISRIKQGQKELNLEEFDHIKQLNISQKKQKVYKSIFDKEKTKFAQKPSDKHLQNKKILENYLLKSKFSFNMTQPLDQKIIQLFKDKASFQTKKTEEGLDRIVGDYLVENYDCQFCIIPLYFRYKNQNYCFIPINKNLQDIKPLNKQVNIIFIKNSYRILTGFEVLLLNSNNPSFEF